MDDLGVKIGIKELDDWYGVTGSKVISLGGQSFLDLYGRSLSKLLTVVYPHHPWDLSRFASKPRHYWTSLENQKRFMDELGRKIGVKELDDWYCVQGSKLIPGARSLFLLYGNSLSKLLASVYPDHPWDVSRFSSKPHNYWTSVENQRRFMNDLGAKIGIGLHDLDGWYTVHWSKLLPLGAKSILDLYDNSLVRVLATVYPNHPWDIAKFSFKPRSYWTSLENQKRFLDELGRKVGIHSVEDFAKWYEQSNGFLLEHGGAVLLSIYSKSLPKLLAVVYPDYDWQLWRFPRTMEQVLESEEELGKLFSIMEDALGIRRPEEWYRVTTEQLTALDLPFFYRSDARGLVGVLSKRYPNVEWDTEAFFGRGYRRANQRWLATMLSDLFQSDNFMVDYTHPELKFQLDVFFPDLHLAFEYQGAQHYESIDVYGGDLSDQAARDEVKAAQCLSRGITLIHVPFWWNKQRSALLATLLAERPDLFTSHLSAFVEEARRGT